MCERERENLQIFYRIQAGRPRPLRQGRKPYAGLPPPGVHRGDGLFGALVVRQAEDSLHGAYEVDSPDHVLMLHDWIHGSTNDEFLGFQHSKSMGVANTILLNGKGRDLHAEVRRWGKTAILSAISDGL